ncbi:hypothetical protein O3M35_011446 [Rhynocoris fuscipes]|uniref:Helicase POLQ-like n=1 Tax=Rhynocoris fuscipes TaxID=488301 RepID=A0AAW1CWB0_9HEMI
MSPLTMSNTDTKFFGLPGKVKEIIQKNRGIYDLYDWQIECLTLEPIKRKKNLVYSLPTSGGKTLVAEILMLKELILYNKNVVFILPFVALVQEKVNLLSTFGLELGFFIEEYSGSKGIYPPPKRMKKRSIYICTIEKALGLINSLLEEKRISEIGLVVVDELHLLGEPNRGAVLENLLTKLLHFDFIQIIGMSATIGNLQDLAKFLRANIYTKNFRPIELKEYIKVEDEIFLVNNHLDLPLVFCKSLKYDKSFDRTKDPDNIGFLVKEVVPNSSCLVFCPSKSNCENVAVMICDSLKHPIYIDHKRKEKEDLLKALLAEGNGNVCPILRKTLRYGVAYHHSGLTGAERKLIEEAYMTGTVYCICCTSTLAAGINLPAQRVILRSPYIGTQFINLSRYKQMVGRAGRAGLGEKGDSYLICQPMDTPKVGNLLISPMDICKSQLHNDELNNFILSLISLNLAMNKASIMNYMNSTLLKVQADFLRINIEDEVEKILCDLVNNKALIMNDILKLTPLAKAAVKGNFSYSLAHHLYNDLIKAQKCLILDNDLHLIYLITPYKITEWYEPKYDALIEAYSSLGCKELNVAHIIGINEVCINSILAGRPIKSVPPIVLHRFFISLIIYDLWKGNNIWKVSSKFHISRGEINNIIGATVGFASAVIRFCDVLDEMWCFTKLLSKFPERLDYCGDNELIELLQLPAVKLGRAKQLYNSGYKDLVSIAKSDPFKLVTSIHHLPLKQAKQIVSVAKLILLSKSESLQEEAEKILQNVSVI